MMKYVMLLIVATLAAAGFALADVVGKVDNTAHAQAGTPSNVSATNGANPGETVVSWDPVAGASEYRVGWLAVADYQANIDNDRWRERFAYSDVNASSSYTVTRLTPGEAYYFITGRKEGDDIAWSAWATLTLNSGALSCPTQPAVAPSTTSDLRVSNGSNPGEVVVSWDVVAGMTGYRVGWLAVPDFEANRDNDRWRERFAYSDISGGSSYYTVTRLTPAIAYYFILGRKQGDDIVWSQWAALALNADAVACPPSGPTQNFPGSAVGGDYDHDDDGLVEVRTLAQLNVIRLDPDGNSLVDIDALPEYLAAFHGALDDMGCPADGCKGYELATNLDFDTNGSGAADAGDAYWNDSAGWEPISLSRNATFDGNGYTIVNLYINLPNLPNAQYPIGLFGSNGGTIRNVVLDGVDVTGGRSRFRSGVGGLVGANYGAIGGSTVNGTVTGEEYVGGLVGHNQGGAISGSTASGTVTGNDYVGGLVGHNQGGAISGSTASGAVTGEEYVGGLVGHNQGGAISGSTASGAVTGEGNVGGLVGHNQGGAISGSTASGAVTGEEYVGGLVGYNSRGNISDSTANGAVTGEDNVGGLAGLNSSSDISDSTANGAVTGNGFVGGLIGQNSSSDISDSTANGGVSGNHRVGGLVGWNYNGGAISGSAASGAVTGEGNVGGLVGHNQGGAIRGSTASGNVSGNDINVGGLIGHNQGGAISGSTASGAVTGEGNVGGLAGRNRGTISSSTASGAVTGEEYVGGLVGYNLYGTISGSTGGGAVTGNGFVGGLIGRNDGTVSDSTASGNVSGNDYVGGVVTSNDYVGGLAGENHGTISASTASGDARGRFYVGGLVGLNWGAIEDCTASGTVTGVRFRGALVGANDGGTIANSIGLGAVTSRQ